jgi:Cu(I)/Ag(I) efflux system membrane fusion protein
VILAEGEGRYRPARVVPGTLSEDRIEILEGLAEGERVVVSSQFLIDSEASLQGAMLRMSPPGPVQTGAEAAPREADGTGTVTSVMAGHGMIDLDHDPMRETEGGDWLISDIQPAGAMSAHDMHDMDDIPEMEETDHSGHADPHGGHRP